MCSTHPAANPHDDSARRPAALHSFPSLVVIEEHSDNARKWDVVSFTTSSRSRSNSLLLLFSVWAEIAKSTCSCLDPLKVVQDHLQSALKHCTCLHTQKISRSNERTMFAASTTASVRDPVSIAQLGPAIEVTTVRLARNCLSDTRGKLPQSYRRPVTC